MIIEYWEHGKGHGAFFVLCCSAACAKLLNLTPCPYSITSSDSLLVIEWSCWDFSFWLLGYAQHNCPQNNGRWYLQWEGSSTAIETWICCKIVHNLLHCTWVHTAYIVEYRFWIVHIGKFQIFFNRVAIDWWIVDTMRKTQTVLSCATIYEQSDWIFKMLPLPVHMQYACDDCRLFHLAGAYAHNRKSRACMCSIEYQTPVVSREADSGVRSNVGWLYFPILKIRFSFHLAPT